MEMKPEFTQPNAYSRLILEEYSLVKWAEAYQIPIAYRMTIEPFFSFTTVVRVWWIKDQFYLVHKCDLNDRDIQRIQLTYPKAQPTVGLNVHQSTLSIAQWEQLDQYMHEQFWTWEQDRWDVEKPFMTLDGVFYTFEGYLLGKYKMLSVDNPHPDYDPSAKAVDLFNALWQW